MALSLLLASPHAAQTGPALGLSHRGPIVDAHNCYPYDGQWGDRIDRALSVGYPVAIEQDLAWHTDPATGRGRAVVSHVTETTGREPGLRDHFFERVRPIVEASMKEQDRSRWPLIVLNLDFKDVRPEILKAVWDTLGEYEPWLTTAVKAAGSDELQPLDVKPLLVLAGAAGAQQKVFYDDLPAGARLRLFGAARGLPIPGETMAQRARAASTLPPDQLLNEKPTNYRRWWNNSWAVVEEGGQRRAGDWTAADERRLHALVRHAHQLGFWVRFYTLNGLTPAEDQGWSGGYNFGSREAVLSRWKAAINAGVDFIATDQYEDLAKVIAEERAR